MKIIKVQNIRLMADYSSDGVWNDRGAMMTRDLLPISQILKDDIETWCLDFESSQFYLDPEDRDGFFDAVGHNARGLALAHRLSDELPDCKITFWACVA